MINTLEKAKEIGAITLDRVNDYIELIRIELEIAERRLLQRAAGLALTWVSLLLAAIFLGAAIIVTCWDSAYRIGAAWAIAIAWLLFAGLCYWRGRSAARLQLQPSRIRSAVQDDIAFLKELL